MPKTSSLNCELVSSNRLSTCSISWRISKDGYHLHNKMNCLWPSTLVSFHLTLLVCWQEQMLCEANKALKRRVSSSLYFRPNLATSRKLCHGLNVTLGSWRRATKPPSNNCGIPTPTAGSNLNHRVTASSNP